ncbi:MAG: hypothetical protein BWX73_02456 [Lentisphaerae bacterium ADurb.Bin082]|nr:MAG: hypothetical protein BWX73_02456 [Lentisphaerae bacterium ADurb.Bin082]
MTSAWKAFGASVRGTSHICACLPNQDFFIIARHLWGDVIVASDGLGSRPTSEYGSKAACRAVVQAAWNWKNMKGDTERLLAQIHKNWLACVEPFEPQKSMATCLFAIRPAEGQIIFGMLGDGLAAVITTDGAYKELVDDKEDSFSNQTDALSEKTQTKHWRIASVAQHECCAVLLCTDGVADDLLAKKRGDFVRHIYEQGQQLASVTMARELRKMLEGWPVPKHSDDKTLVCLYRRENGK